MIKQKKIKFPPVGLKPLQNLSFEQKIYLKNPKIQDLHGKLVNNLYDLQNWHYFYKEELSFDKKVELFNQWFGPYNFKKKLRDKGDTYLWVLKINESTYCLYLCSFAFFIETQISTPFEKSIDDIKELSELIFSQSDHKPKGFK